MEDELIEEIVKIKTDMILSSTKYSISGSGVQNDRTVLDSVVLSWLESVNNSQDLKNKYELFKKMDQLIRRSYLFDYVQAIAAEKQDRSVVLHAMGIYQKIIQEEEYQALSPQCGFQLSDQFRKEACYYDGTLQKQVQFYYSFRDKINSIYAELLRKGVFQR